MIIYDKSDNLLLDIPVDDTSYRYRAIRQGDKVYLYFSLTEHVDESGNHIRQIVTLTDTIPGHPADLNGNYCGGNRIVALTPKEMAALREQGRIWGELWMVCADRKTKINSDRLRPIELTCWRYPAVSHYAFALSGEVMTYIDSDGRDKMCLAANRELWKAEYTTCDSDGKYDSCLITIDADTEREYITKSLIYYEGY